MDITANKPIGIVAPAILLAVVVAGTSPGQTPTAAADATFFFRDAFPGSVLDRSKWNVEITGETYNNEQQAYVDSGDTIYLARGDEAAGGSDGALVIHARHRPGFKTPQGRGVDFVSGRMNTRGKFDFAHGSAAARIKLPNGSGLARVLLGMALGPPPARSTSWSTSAGD